jgi:hypothetical protein
VGIYSVEYLCCEACAKRHHIQVKAHTLESARRCVELLGFVVKDVEHAPTLRFPRSFEGCSSDEIVTQELRIPSAES